VAWEFAEAQRLGGEALERVRAKYLRRMWDLSEFMKTLKQKFTGWFNRKHARVGTLWESRFKSVVVEGSWQCLLKVAAYIDLNAVRAGMVEDPKDYRWCGYAEAVGGDRAARRGLAAALADFKAGAGDGGGDGGNASAHAHAHATWRDVGPRYRKVLFGIGEETAERGGGSRLMQAAPRAAQASERCGPPGRREARAIRSRAGMSVAHVSIPRRGCSTVAGR